MKPEIKDVVNMGDLICLLATVRTLKLAWVQINCKFCFDVQGSNYSNPHQSINEHSLRPSRLCSAGLGAVYERTHIWQWRRAYMTVCGISRSVIYTNFSYDGQNGGYRATWGGGYVIGVGLEPFLSFPGELTLPLWSSRGVEPPNPPPI